MSEGGLGERIHLISSRVPRYHGNASRNTQITPHGANGRKNLFQQSICTSFWLLFSHSVAPAKGRKKIGRL